MIKTARQLKDLIRNLSKKNAADAQVLMRNYMMERFLERISLSLYAVRRTKAAAGSWRSSNARSAYYHTGRTYKWAGWYEYAECQPRDPQAGEDGAYHYRHYP